MLELNIQTINNPPDFSGEIDINQQVDFEIDPKSEFPRYFSGGMVVTTKDGGEFVHHERINRGAGERAMSGDEIGAKFTDNALLAASPEKVDAVRESVLGLDGVGAKDLAESLTAQ